MSREIIIEAKVRVVIEVNEEEDAHWSHKLPAEEIVDSVMENADYEFISNSDEGTIIEQDIEEWNVTKEIV